jgi:hypothetical protein
MRYACSSTPIPFWIDIGVGNSVRGHRTNGVRIIMVLLTPPRKIFYGGINRERELTTPFLF